MATGFVLEAGFVFVLEEGALVAAFTALTAAAFAAGFLERSASEEPRRDFILTFFASAFLLETFFGFPTVVVFFAVIFFEETLGVVVFLIVGFEGAFALDLLDAVAFLTFSVVPFEAVLECSVAELFTALAFLGLSLVEAGFLTVLALFLLEAGFLF